MSLFRKATKKTARLRMALIGPSGSGKTYSALAVATHLAERPDGSPGRIAVIDTERGSASKYSDEFNFEVVELASYDPRTYIDAIQAAEQERFDVLIVDSLTHAWSGKGGALEMVDNAAKRTRSNNSFTAWRDVTPLHNALVDAMIGSGCHLIATMRSKSEYALEADPNTGKLTPRKLGLAPIQREGMDYEFDVVGDLDLDHVLVIGKTRCKALDRATFNPPGRQLAAVLKNWLTDGAPAMAPTAAAQNTVTNSGATPTTQPGGGASAGPIDIPPIGLVTAEQLAELQRLIAETGMTDVQIRTALAKRGVADLARLTTSDAAGMIANLEAILDRKRWEAQTFMTQEEHERHQAQQAQSADSQNPTNGGSAATAPATETPVTAPVDAAPATQPAADAGAESDGEPTDESVDDSAAAENHVIAPVTRRERPEPEQPRPRKSRSESRGETQPVQS